VTAGEPDLDQLQGLLTSAFPRSPAGRYVLVALPDAERGRAWLRSLLPTITFSDEVGEQIRARRAADRPAVNVAFTAAGLAALGVPADRTADFSREFREGMVTPHRQRILGDLDGSPSDPRGWRWGGPGTDPVHAVLLLFGADEAALDDVVGELLGAATGVRVVHTVPTVAIADGREHFGFRDAIASPWVPGLHRDRAKRDRVAAGELVLGRPDLTGQPEPFPPVGRDGSYLVIRQLAQDVPGFWTALRQSVGDAQAVRWAAKMTGRWPDGTALIRSPGGAAADASDDFGYHDDPDGVRCPLGAHIRRANPRDGLGTRPDESIRLVNRHRIFRRGRPFGAAAPWPTWPAGIDPVVVDSGPPDDSGERGVVFVCLGASLARQFEFVTQSWVNNPKFAGLYDEADPITGAPHRRMSGTRGSATGFEFTAPGPVLNERIDRPATYVRCVGGGYFFLPGRRGLALIAAEA
jgi:Dyp-type peroxidase family